MGLEILNLLIRSYFTTPNLRLKTPALRLVVCPLASAEVCCFPSRLRYFAAVLVARVGDHGAAEVLALVDRRLWLRRFELGAGEMCATPRRKADPCTASSLVTVDAAAIALVGAAVGALITFSFGQIDTRLRRRRQGRTAARLLWFELMSARATVREMKSAGVWVGDRPFLKEAWDTQREAFTEVADSYAFAVVGLAYNELAGLEHAYDRLVSLQMLEHEDVHPKVLNVVEALGPKIPSPLPERCFDALEKALVQLDRYSGLAKHPVDYAELDKESGLNR